MWTERMELTFIAEVHLFCLEKNSKRNLSFKHSKGRARLKMLEIKAESSKLLPYILVVLPTNSSHLVNQFRRLYLYLNSSFQNVLNTTWRSNVEIIMPNRLRKMKKFWIYKNAIPYILNSETNRIQKHPQSSKLGLSTERRRILSFFSSFLRKWTTIGLNNSQFLSYQLLVSYQTWKTRAYAHFICEADPITSLHRELSKKTRVWISFIFQAWKIPEIWQTTVK